MSFKSLFTSWVNLHFIPSALPQRAAGVYVTNWLTATVEQFLLVRERTRVVAFHVSVPIKAKWSYFRRCLAMQMKTKGYITWHTHEFFGVFTFCVSRRLAFSEMNTMDGTCLSLLCKQLLVFSMSRVYFFVFFKLNKFVSIFLETITSN